MQFIDTSTKTELCNPWSSSNIIVCAKSPVISFFPFFQKQIKGLQVKKKHP